MPTGYTADVGDGKITDLKAFTYRCARAFGAMILMRDDPVDAPIPAQFEPNVSYYGEALAAARSELERLSALDDAGLIEAAGEAFQKKHAAWAQRQQDRETTRARYEMMLAKVREWAPPTSEHRGLKDFMTKQLVDSIEFDCSSEYDDEPTSSHPRDWLSAAIADAESSVSRYSEEIEKEIARTADRNSWLKALRSSFERENETVS